MAMTPGPGRGGMKAEINVTPLVDVVLVLLIIFMVVTPMMQKGRAVQLPKAAHSSSSGPKAEPLVLSITADQKLFVESDRVADLAEFKSRLEQELRSQPARRIRLKADQALTCGDVQEVMEAINASGAKNVGLGVEMMPRTASPP